MTIAEDTTNSPALVVSSGATTDTAAFTPPNAGCILVCFMFGDANSGALDESLTASDTLGGTWSTPVLDNARGGAAVAISWRAVAAGTAASMVVKVTDNKGSVAKGNFTRIFTGTDLTAPFGATGTAGTSNISLVSTVTNSWCWSALLTSNVLQVAGANTTQKTEFGGFDSGDSIGVYASTNTTATAGTTITLAESGGTPVHNVAIELLPPSGGGATVNATVAFAAGAQLAASGVVTELGRRHDGGHRDADGFPRRRHDGQHRAGGHRRGHQAGRRYDGGRRHHDPGGVRYRPAGRWIRGRRRARCSGQQDGCRCVAVQRRRTADHRRDQHAGQRGGNGGRRQLLDHGGQPGAARRQRADPRRLERLNAGAQRRGHGDARLRRRAGRCADPRRRGSVRADLQRRARQYAERGRGVRGASWATRG
jgi:hypothetical protein